MSTLRIGDRVRLRGSTEQVGTIAANPYTFRYVRRVVVIWDAFPGWLAVVAGAPLAFVSVSSLVRVQVKPAPSGVAPEARPVSVGALAGGGR